MEIDSVVSPILRSSRMNFPIAIVTNLMAYVSLIFTLRKEEID